MDQRRLFVLVAVMGGLAGRSAAAGQTPAKPGAPAAPAAEPGKDVVPPPPGTVDLRPKFVAGKQIKYVLQQDSRNQVKPLDDSGEGISQDSKQSTRIGLAMKVVDSGAEGATIQVVYESIKVTLVSDGETTEYDSAKPKPVTKAPAKQPATTPAGKPGQKTPTPTSPTASDPLKGIGDLDGNKMLEQIVGPMVGTTITVKTDKSGAITSVSGGEALGGGGLMGGGAGLVPNAQQMANWLVSGVGGPNGQGYAKVGESWTNNDSLSGTPVGAFKMTTTHTLKSSLGGNATVGFVGKVEAPSESSSPGAGLAQVQNAAYTGSYVWDTKQGSLSDMTSSMSVVMDGGMVGMKARMSSDSKVRVTRGSDFGSK